MIPLIEEDFLKSWLGSRKALFWLALGRTPQTGYIWRASSGTDFKQLHDFAFWTECLSELKALNEMRVGDTQITCVLQKSFE